jgi:alanine dehydrogenase
MRVLSDDDVAAVLSLTELLDVCESAFLADGRGETVRPERPHYPIGAGLDGPDPLGTGLTMPAYIEGADHVATKLATVHPANPERDMPTIHAQLSLTDARTGEPTALLAAERLTKARTGCIGGLAARELATGDEEGRLTVGVLGAGAQARWQTRAIAAAREVDEVRVYSPSDSRARCAADLRGRGLDAGAVDSPHAAVTDAHVVVTATTSHDPVFPADALAPGALVVAIGAYTSEMRELDPGVFERTARVFADVPEEVAEIGDLAGTGLEAADLVPLSAVLAGEAGRERDDEILVAESVGTAVLDAAGGAHLYERAVDAGLGTDVSL